MADTEQKQPPPPYVPPSQVDPAELAKAFEAEGIVEPKAEAAKPPPPVPDAPAKPAEDDGIPTLLKKAKERDAARKAAEAQKPKEEFLRAFTPQEAERLAQARLSGDPVAALQALGFTHQQYNARLAGIAQEPEKAAEDDAPPVVKTLQQELAALKAEREREKVEATRREFLSRTQSLLKDDPKFSHINALGDFESIEAAVIDHHRRYGELPGDTLEESIKLAAEVVEYNLKQQAEKWKKVLTPSSTPAPVAAKAPESQPSAGTVATRTLTNANTTAPAAVRTVPKSREEVIAALVEGRDDDLA